MKIMIFSSFFYLRIGHKENYLRNDLTDYGNIKFKVGQHGLKVSSLSSRCEKQQNSKIENCVIGEKTVRIFLCIYSFIFWLKAGTHCATINFKYYINWIIFKTVKLLTDSKNEEGLSSSPKISLDLFQ